MSYPLILLPVVSWIPWDFLFLCVQVQEVNTSSLPDRPREARVVCFSCFSFYRGNLFLLPTLLGYITSPLFTHLCLSLSFSHSLSPPSVMQKHNGEPHSGQGFLSRAPGGYFEKSELCSWLWWCFSWCWLGLMLIFLQYWCLPILVKRPHHLVPLIWAQQMSVIKKGTRGYNGRQRREEPVRCWRRRKGKDRGVVLAEPLLCATSFAWYFTYIIPFNPPVRTD